jgi:hypothetical protein
VSHFLRIMQISAPDAVVRRIQARLEQVLGLLILPNFSKAECVHA